MRKCHQGHPVGTLFSGNLKRKDKMFLFKAHTWDKTNELQKSNISAVFKEQMASKPKHVEFTWNCLGKGTTFHLSEGGIFITAYKHRGVFPKYSWDELEDRLMVSNLTRRFKNTQRKFLPKYQGHYKNIWEVTRADGIF